MRLMIDDIAQQDDVKIIHRNCVRCRASVDRTADTVTAQHRDQWAVTAIISHNIVDLSVLLSIRQQQQWHDGIGTFQLLQSVELWGTDLLCEVHRSYPAIAG